MPWSKKLTWFFAGGLLLPLPFAALIFLTLDRASRPPAPPEQGAVPMPWGAIDIDEVDLDAMADLQQSLEQSFKEEGAGDFDPDGDGIATYSLLALSGGGPNGAFGAGLLSGWTASGTRPDFKVVTGVSTGSLQASFAFLGPEYDDTLKAIFTHETKEIYARRGPLAAALDDAVYDSWPLKHLIDKYATEEVLAKVAAKHAEGHRLYVGTTNLDTSEFVIWDMGEIASSKRPDAVEHYRKVLLASCSMPVFFPPVYFEVEVDGESRYEMHTDGGTHAQAFFRGFLLEFEDAVEGVEAGGASAPVIDLFVIRNGTIHEQPVRQTVSPRALTIATRMIDGLLEISTRSSIYRIYVLAARYHMNFYLAAIPAEFEGGPSKVTEFEPAAMRRLFNLGYRLAEKGFDWQRQPYRIDPDEIMRPAPTAS